MTKSVSSIERFHNLRFDRTVLLSCTRSTRRSRVQSAAGLVTIEAIPSLASRKRFVSKTKSS
jgi:hypothetical protein